MEILGWNVTAGLILGMAFLFSFPANAENIPRMISYDGSLTDSTGAIAPHDVHYRELNIYNA